MYNSYMEEVDWFDQNIHAQKISFRGKKWWFPLFALSIDASCQNAWNLYKYISGKNTTYCEYRRKIVQYYLEKYGALAKISVQCGSKERVTPFVRKDNFLEHIKE